MQQNTHLALLQQQNTHDHLLLQQLLLATADNNQSNQDLLTLTRSLLQQQHKLLTNLNSNVAPPVAPSSPILNVAFDQRSFNAYLAQGIKYLQLAEFSLAKWQFARALLLDEENMLAKAYFALASFEENPLSDDTSQYIAWALSAQADLEASSIATLALATIFRHQQHHHRAKELYRSLLQSNYSFGSEQQAILAYLKETD